MVLPMPSYAASARFEEEGSDGRSRKVWDNAPIHFASYNAELEHHDIDPAGVDCFENNS